jgi:hypothetical protein
MRHILNLFVIHSFSVPRSFHCVSCMDLSHEWVFFKTKVSIVSTSSSPLSSPYLLANMSIDIMLKLHSLASSIYGVFIYYP